LKTILISCISIETFYVGNPILSISSRVLPLAPLISSYFPVKYKIWMTKEQRLLQFYRFAT
jgi:hypothetical protein